MYAVLCGDDGEWLIEVVVGGIALHGQRYRLREAEVEEFRRQGQLPDLARDIARHSERYADRRLP